MPHLLRPLFRRRRELLTELGRATSGALAQWHPHLHLLSADGGNGGRLVAGDGGVGVSGGATVCAATVLTAQVAGVVFRV